MGYTGLLALDGCEILFWMVNPALFSYSELLKAIFWGLLLRLVVELHFSLGSLKSILLSRYAVLLSVLPTLGAPITSDPFLVPDLGVLLQVHVRRPDPTASG